MNSFRPIQDWVLVEMDPLTEKNRGGIIILKDTTGNTVRTGTVLRTGPGKTDKHGNRIPIGVEKGEKVAFFRWNMEHQQGQQVVDRLKDLGDNLGLIRVSDILFAFRDGEKIEIG